MSKDGGSVFPDVGHYAMHRMRKDGDGTPVLIDGKTESGRFSIKYVQILPGGTVIEGGGSFWWDADEFFPITDAINLSACKCYAARLAAKEYEKKAAAEKTNAATWQAAVQALCEASAMLVESERRSK